MLDINKKIQDLVSEILSEIKKAFTHQINNYSAILLYFKLKMGSFRRSLFFLFKKY